MTGGTDNHLLLVDLRDFDAELTGKEAQEVLDLAGITLNRNQIPDDPRSPFVTSGLRLGSAAETTAGMGPDEFATVASLIARSLRSRGDEAAQAAVRTEVTALCASFPPYPGRCRRADGRAVGWYVLIAATAGITTFVLTGPARVVARKVGLRLRPERPVRALAHHALRRRGRDVLGAVRRDRARRVRPRPARHLRGAQRARGRRPCERGDPRRRARRRPPQHVRARQGRRRGPRRLRPVLRRRDDGAAQDPVLRERSCSARGSSRSSRRCG